MTTITSRHSGGNQSQAKPQETPADALARIQGGNSKNDLIVLMTFNAVGIPHDDIFPRQNVLTYRAWLAKDRQVAKGAISQKITTWIPGKVKLDDDGKPKRGRMHPKTARVFHISQTLPKGSPAGTKPEAWRNENLIRPGTYGPETER